MATGLFLLTLLCPGTSAITVASASQPAGFCSGPNAAAKEYLDVIETSRVEDPALAEALRLFPKGADLHNHLSGAIMPEQYLAMGTADGDCFGPEAAASTAFTIATAGVSGRCPEHLKHLATASAADRRQIVQSLSMYQFPYPTVQSGHDHFFAAFRRFEAVSKTPWNTGQMLAMMLQQAASDSVSYVETMVSFQSTVVATLASRLRERYPEASYDDPANYPEMYGFLVGAGLKDAVAWAHNDLTMYDNRANALLRCGLQDRDPACGVSYSYLAAVNRNNDLARIFTQAAFSFLLASTDPRVVGVNLVSGEDLEPSMSTFRKQMQVFTFLHHRFPSVSIALHAGELTPCFVDAAEPLKEHLVGSLNAGAKRIGHGVSFAFLGDADRSEVADLFKKKGALAEIMFTSNAQILGVTGEEHPFRKYRDLGVPTAFSTDDQGVSHLDFTGEWIYAVQRYGLTAKDLVRLSRESLQHSFIAGEPLWVDVAEERVVPHCGGVTLGAAAPPATCGAFLAGNPKAQAQWDHEAKLADFLRRRGNELRKKVVTTDPHPPGR